MAGAVSELMYDERLSIVMLIATILLALMRWRPSEGATLRGSLVWLLIALTVNLVVELAIQSAASPTRGWSTALRFVAATSLFCPQVSVLGAKRPQHRAWHAIVLSLWLVLILPAAEGYFVRRSGALEVHDARGWFLWILILVGCGNYLATRRWVSAIGYAAAQVMLLAAHLPLLRAEVAAPVRQTAFIAIFVAALLIVFQRKTRSTDGLRGTWQEFRDAYGAGWSLRVMDRLNTTARIAHWPVELTWNGMNTTSHLSEKQQKSLERCLRTVFRRFMAPHWVKSHVDLNMNVNDE